jgi:hypothetical protein
MQNNNRRTSIPYTGWTVRCLNPSTEKRFVFPPKRPDRLWDPPSLLFNGYREGDSFPGVKREEREAGHSPPCRAQVKNEWGYISPLPLCAFMACIDSFYFLYQSSLKFHFLSTCLLSFSYAISAIPTLSVFFPLHVEHPHHPHGHDIIPISSFATSVRDITRKPVV